MTRFALRLAGAALAMGMALPAAALAGYGAIYFSPSNHAYGYSVDEYDRQDAVDVAWAHCAQHADDCTKGIEFWNGSCGAIAVGDRGGWGASWGEEMDFALNGAVAACQKRDRGCEILAYQCSSRN